MSKRSMTSHHTIVSAEYAGMRLDAFLASRFLPSMPAAAARVDSTSQKQSSRPDPFPESQPAPLDLSRTALQRLIAAGQVTVNGHKVKASLRLKPGDRVEILWNPPLDSKLEPEPIHLSILHEDEDLIVVNKPPGMVVHPAAGNPRGTLVNALLHHCPDLPGIGGERRPGIVHRLDKDTSGVMVVAKQEKTFRHLSLQFKNRSVTKEYAAFVWGRMEPEKGIIQRPIGRHRSDRKKMSSLHSLPRTRSAVTEWKVENAFGLPGGGKSLTWVTWVRVSPRTGRTHQIRVHLADQGFPVIRDQIYGRKRRSAEDDGPVLSRIAKFPRQALHADTLRFVHPRTGDPQAFTAPWFEDMKGLLEYFKEHCVEKNSKKDYRG